MTTLEKHYKEVIIPKLMLDFAIKNNMAVPKLVKIVLNCSLGEALSDKKVVEKASVQIAAITGLHPVATKAKKAISSFKVREGDIIGLKVTMRAKRMYDFMMRLTGVALPRVRDFRGVPKRGFDGKGNYTLGIAEQTIFPDLDYALVDKVRGFEITFVTTAQMDDQAKALLSLLGLPFEK